MSKDFMKVEDAIEIVMTLASENVISEAEAMNDSEVLVPMREEQLLALDTVQDFFMNNVFR
jgi:hypothetical protein